MMYLEFSDAALNKVPAKYGYVVSANDIVQSVTQYGLSITTYIQLANRVWIEDNQGLRYVKNRYEDPRTAKVDMEEFFWIKLQSVRLK